MTAISDLEQRVFAALRGTSWRTVEDVATHAQVPMPTAQLFCWLLFSEGHAVRRLERLGFRYRANTACMQTPHRAHFAALMAATEPAKQEA